MRTSNKILLGLIIVIFTVPLLLAASLRAKVKNGQYTVEKLDYAKNERLVAGSFKPCKVVKIVAPKPDLLTCYINTSDKMSYSYYKKGGKDSINILAVNDTLLVQYLPFSAINPDDQNKDWDRMFELHINLPAINGLVVDGAVVLIDSFPPTPNNISVILKNRGELKEGRSREDEAAAATSKVVGGKKSVELPKAYQPKNVVALEESSFETLKASRPEVADLNIKELLVYNLLFRI